ncbi:MAG: glycosyltransferase [Chloroflexi bacterium]|nr:glycosyltransferase [Chloroflexota bacterium]
MSHPTYSIVLPIYNEEATLAEMYKRVSAVMNALDAPGEMILINDGSRDRSMEMLRELHQRDKRVKVINFSRNFGHEIALLAGLDAADGDAVIAMDADLQDPPELIPQLIAKWHEGYDVVYAVRAKREGESFFKKFSASLFYRLIARLTDLKIPRDTGNFRLMDHKVVEALRQVREHHRFMRGISVWVGFKQVGIPFVRQERFAGETKYPLSKMVRLAISGITSFSYVPLQMATTAGFIFAGLALVAIPIVAILRLMGSDFFFGQATTLISVLLLGGVQLIFLGIIGEYLGRIYDEVKKRPLYLVAEKIGFEEEAETATKKRKRKEKHPVPPPIAPPPPTPPITEAAPAPIKLSDKQVMDQVYKLAQKYGGENYGGFGELESKWSLIESSLPLFLQGDSGRLQFVCGKLENFLSFSGRWDERLDLNLKAEERAIAKKDLYNAGWRAVGAGYVYQRRDEAAEVLKCAARAEGYWKKAGAREKAAALYLRGIGHQLEKNYPAAITSYKEMLALDKKRKAESADVAADFNSLAEAERLSGDYASAERDYNEALQIAKKVKDQEGIAIYTHNMAELALDRQDWSRAESLGREALPLAEKLNRKEMIAASCLALSRALAKQDRKQDGLPFAQRALEIYERLKSKDVEKARDALQDFRSASHKTSEVRGL